MWGGGRLFIGGQFLHFCRILPLAMHVDAPPECEISLPSRLLFTPFKRYQPPATNDIYGGSLPVPSSLDLDWMLLECGRGRAARCGPELFFSLGADIFFWEWWGGDCRFIQQLCRVQSAAFLVAFNHLPPH